MFFLVVHSAGSLLSRRLVVGIHEILLVEASIIQLVEFSGSSVPHFFSRSP